MEDTIAIAQTVIDCLKISLHAQVYATIIINIFLGVDLISLNENPYLVLQLFTCKDMEYEIIEIIVIQWSIFRSLTLIALMTPNVIKYTEYVTCIRILFTDICNDNVTNVVWTSSSNNLNKCVWRSDTRVTWDEAFTACYAMKGRLMTKEEMLKVTTIYLLKSASNIKLMLHCKLTTIDLAKKKTIIK